MLLLVLVLGGAVGTPLDSAQKMSDKRLEDGQPPAKKLASDKEKDGEQHGKALVPGKDYPGVGVGAWVFDAQDRVLLVKRSSKSRNEPGTWSRPGGAVEFGETCEEALAREMLEETNLSIACPKVLDVTSQVVAGKTHWVAIGYIAELAPGCSAADAQNREPDKHDALEWFSLDALPSPLASFCVEGVEKLRCARRGQPAVLKHSKSLPAD
eukprot:gnl/TRDRNA2_/TRDRNA2_196309_c0_seq1.p1 gnl/TRDRNA2_/TRDRNA2_196309_c0~~gnl/TRDRNA2_/TRDRNA2_196309_c0_seq1.p1  ORF type:complete len:211 (+),score=39.59 gnl/TRDRNA2_/TRDRNA2_196309_c0_seq1:43-675(+)